MSEKKREGEREREREGEREREREGERERQRERDRGREGERPRLKQRASQREREAGHTSTDRRETGCVVGSASYCVTTGERGERWGGGE